MSDDTKPDRPAGKVMIEIDHCPRCGLINSYVQDPSLGIQLVPEKMCSCAPLSDDELAEKPMRWIRYLFSIEKETWITLVIFLIAGFSIFWCISMWIAVRL